MNSNKQNLINKIIYRSQYRGTKEMDIFVSSFVKSIIDSLSFPDHFNYKRNDIDKILLKCKEQSAIPVTTYKDYVKIPDDLKKNFSVVNIHIIFDKSSFFNFINNNINLHV